MEATVVSGDGGARGVMQVRDPGVQVEKALRPSS